MNLKAGFAPDIALIALNPCATAFSHGYGRVNLLNIFRTVIAGLTTQAVEATGKKLFIFLPRRRKIHQQSTLPPAHKKTRTILFSTPMEYEDSRNGVRPNIDHIWLDAFL